MVGRRERGPVTGTTSLILAGEPGEEGSARGEGSEASENVNVAAEEAAFRIEEAAEYGEGDTWVVLEAVMPGTLTKTFFWFSVFSFSLWLPSTR